MADAIYDRDIDSVSDGVGTLDGPPGVMLSFAELRFFRGMPPDRRGIEQHLCPLQSSEARPLGIPLVPTNKCPYLSKRSVKTLKPQITRGEIKLFVIKRIVGDVHLSIHAAQAAIGFDNGGGIVVDAGSATLK